MNDEKQFLDYEGLAHFWELIKERFVEKTELEPIVNAIQELPTRAEIEEMVNEIDLPEEIKEKLNALPDVEALETIHFGTESVASFDDLPSDAKVGAVYNVQGEESEDGMNYLWNGTSWDAMGGADDCTNPIPFPSIDALMGIIEEPIMNDADEVEYSYDRNTNVIKLSNVLKNPGCLVLYTTNPFPITVTINNQEVEGVVVGVVNKQNAIEIQLPNILDDGENNIAITIGDETKSAQETIDANYPHLSRSITVSAPDVHDETMPGFPDGYTCIFFLGLVQPGYNKFYDEKYTYTFTFEQVEDSIVVKDMVCDNLPASKSNKYVPNDYHLFINGAITEWPWTQVRVAIYNESGIKVNEGTYLLTARR